MKKNCLRIASVLAALIYMFGSACAVAAENKTPFAALSLLLFGGNIHAVTVLDDSGFEDCNWNWNTGTWCDGVQQHSGKKSAGIWCNSSENRAINQVMTGAPSNTVYTLSYWLKTIDGNPTCYGVMHFLDGNGQPVSDGVDWNSAPDKSSTDGVWELRSFAATSTADTRQVRVFIRCDAGTDGAKAYFDDIAVSIGGGSATKREDFGHYVVVRKDYQQTTAQEKDGVKGIVRAYLWKDLEPSKGDYSGLDTIVAKDFNDSKENNKYFIVQVEHRTFDGEHPLPEYMRDIEVEYNVSTGTSSGRKSYCALTWTEKFEERYKKLIDAIAARFKADVMFEGVASEESALGFDDSVYSQYDYNPQTLVNRWAAIANYGNSTLGSARFFWMANFIPGWGDVTTHEARELLWDNIDNNIVSNEVPVGGPDTNFANTSSAVYRYVHTHQIANPHHMVFTRAAGDMHSSDCIQDDSADTATQVINFATQTLHAKYLWWLATNSTCYGGIDDVYEAIKQNPQL